MRIVLNHGGHAFADQLAIVHDVNIIGNAHHQTHVVLDQQNAVSHARQGMDKLRQLLGFHRIQTRRRFVQQQHLRLANQCSGDFKLLLHTIGQVADLSSAYCSMPRIWSMCRAF